jgi:hypothetical protein
MYNIYLSPPAHHTYRPCVRHVNIAINSYPLRFFTLSVNLCEIFSQVSSCKLTSLVSVSLHHSIHFGSSFVCQLALGPRFVFSNSLPSLAISKRGACRARPRLWLAIGSATRNEHAIQNFVHLQSMRGWRQMLVELLQ